MSVRMLEANSRSASAAPAAEESAAAGRRGGAGGLSVFWLAEDVISRHGLPPLLQQVPVVEKAVVRQGVEESADLLTVCAFDIAVVPFALCSESLLRAVRSRPHTKLLVVLREEEVKSVRTFAHSHTVDGYLLQQDIDETMLTDVLSQASKGDVPMPSVLVRELMTVVQPDGPRADPQAMARLTERERAVLALLLQGLSNHQIARAMDISLHGVKRHVSNLLVKFNCTNRTEAALVAVRLGMTAS